MRRTNFEKSFRIRSRRFLISFLSFFRSLVFSVVPARPVGQPFGNPETEIRDDVCRLSHPCFWRARHESVVVPLCTIVGVCQTAPSSGLKETMAGLNHCHPLINAVSARGPIDSSQAFPRFFAGVARKTQLSPKRLVGTSFFGQVRPRPRLGALIAKTMVPAGEKRTEIRL